MHSSLNAVGLQTELIPNAQQNRLPPETAAIFNYSQRLVRLDELKEQCRQMVFLPFDEFAKVNMVGVTLAGSYLGDHFPSLHLHCQHSETLDKVCHHKRHTARAACTVHGLFLLCSVSVPPAQHQCFDFVNFN